MVLLAAYGALSFLANRQQRFRLMSVAKVVLSAATVLLSFAGAWWRVPGGMILGLVSGQAVAVLVLGMALLRRLGSAGACALPRLRTLASRYSGFPRFSLAADSLNVVSNQIPVMLLSSLFGGAVVGFYNLTLRVLGAPISIIGRAFLEVFNQKASRDYAREGNCRETYLRTLRILSIVALPVFLGLMLVAPQLFALVFGAEWRTAGVYAQVLAPMFYLRFVASPLSYTLYIAGKQRYDLYWQMALLLATLLSLLCGAGLRDRFGEMAAIVLFACSYSVLYVVYLLMSYRFAQGEAGSAPTGS
jgi:O-antigen/teichoic acid export membrane protein